MEKYPGSEVLPAGWKTHVTLGENIWSYISHIPPPCPSASRVLGGHCGTWPSAGGVPEGAEGSQHTVIQVCDPQESVNSKESLLNYNPMPSRANGWILTLLQSIFRGVCVCVSMLGIENGGYCMKSDCRRMQVYLCKQMWSELGAQVLQLLWHFTWVFAFCKFWPNKTNCSFFFFLSEGNTERTEQIHVLFVCCLKCMPGRKALFCQLCEGQKYTTTFSSAEGRTLSVSIQGLHRGRRYIVRQGTCFPDSNINSFFFFCVLFTVRRNQIFPNGPL